MSNRAVFLDRDGVLNALAFHAAANAHESPHTLDELALMPGAALAARRLQDAGFLLFIVSNQPSYAKGTATLESIRAIAAKIDELLRAGGVKISRAFYCFHHPQGVVAEYSGECRCRKPKPQLLLDARDEFDVDLSLSWMIGDQETDVECGRRAGCRTVLIENPHSAARRTGVEKPTLLAADLSDAAEKLLRAAGARQ
jgi:D-glycero-D-manno-heptose 1,7-bisphosphate phosphatase